MSEFFGSVWWLIVTLGVLITFHEFGHFVVARRCGVKVLRFSVGFGKSLWSRFDRHGTEFVVAAIPLGGPLPNAAANPCGRCRSVLRRGDHTLRNPTRS